MRTAFKLILPLIISVAVVSVLYAAYQVRTERRHLRQELDRRAEVLAESLQEAVEPLMGEDVGAARTNLQRIVARFGQREHLKAIGVYDPVGVPLAVTPGYNSQLGLRPATATRAGSADKGQAEYTRFDGSSMHIYAIPLHRSGAVARTLVLLHDASYIDTQISHNLRESLLTALLQTALISGLALELVRFNSIPPLTKTSK